MSFLTLHSDANGYELPLDSKSAKIIVMRTILVFFCGITAIAIDANCSWHQHAARITTLHKLTVVLYYYSGMKMNATLCWIQKRLTNHDGTQGMSFSSIEVMKNEDTIPVFGSKILTTTCIPTMGHF